RATRRRLASGSVGSASTTSSLVTGIGGRFSPTPASLFGSNSSPQLLVERDERELERLHGLVVRDDVVAGLEHLQQAARARDVLRPKLREPRYDLIPLA